ncbi:MAG: NYN domain-containing protein [Candidatus Ratteibacteria bacterium]|nr:NYN domain-containing protein [Candidatus Ratteibacteria bacterium]
MEKEHKKALVLIDDSNLYYGFKFQERKLDYEKFYLWLKKEFNPIDIFFFGGIISKKTFFDRHPAHTISGFVKAQKDRKSFLRKLKNIGYKVRTKPVTSVYDSTEGDYKRKCNFDVEITISAIDRLQEYEELVLCSGDGDFIKLAKYIKGKHKKVTIVAHKDRLNSNLAITANRKVFFQDIRALVEKKKELP